MPTALITSWLEPDQNSTADLLLDEYISLQINQSVISVSFFPEPIFVHKNNIVLDIK